MEINWHRFQEMVVYKKLHLNIKTDVDANSHEINSIAQTIEHQSSEFAGDKNGYVRYQFF